MKIKLTSVFVNDQNKALDFYTKTLGFVKKTDISAGNYRWLTVVSAEDPNGSQLVLEPNANPAARTYQESILKQGIPATMFFVDDIQKEVQRLKKLGVHFTMEATNAPGSTIAQFHDTVGNLIQITQLSEPPPAYVGTTGSEWRYKVQTHDATTTNVSPKTIRVASEATTMYCSSLYLSHFFSYVMFSLVRRDVFRWGTPDPEGDWIMVGHLFVRDSEIILIDPPLIPGLIESITRVGKPKAIILTSQNHTTGSKYIKEKTGATGYVPYQNPNAVEPQDALAVKEIGQFEKYNTGKLLGFEIFRDFNDFALLTDNKEIIISDNATGSPDGKLLVFPEYIPHDPPHPANATVRTEFKDLVKKTGAVTLLAGHGYNIYGNLQDLANRK